MYLCKKCGSKEIQQKEWVDSNTGENQGLIDETDPEVWCNGCQESNNWTEDVFEVPDDGYKLHAAQHLWEKLGDVPINTNEEIEKKFLHFEPGTDKEDIWHWFESNFEVSVAKQLMKVE